MRSEGGLKKLFSPMQGIIKKISSNDPNHQDHEHNNFTKKMIANGYGYRTGHPHLSDLKDLLYKEVVELRNFHVIRDLADSLGVERLEGGTEIDEIYSEEAVLDGVIVDPTDINDLAKKARKKWGKGKAVWLSTKEGVEERYIKELGFGKELYLVRLPSDAKVISELGQDGTLFYVPEENKHACST